MIERLVLAPRIVQEVSDVVVEDGDPVQVAVPGPEVNASCAASRASSMRPSEA